jgi:hypothetical protein
MNDDYQDEPAVTGWLTTQLSGDKQAAAQHVGHARKLLGQLRSRNGVNARQAAGEVPGFFRHNSVMPDGSRISVVSNNGQDIIAVHSPLSETPGRFIPPELHSTPEQSEATLPEPDVPMPTFSRSSEEKSEPSEEEEKKVEEERIEPRPYMWVGIRIKLEEGALNQIGNPTIPRQSILACMVEPAVVGRQRGIIVADDWYARVMADLSDDQPTLSPELGAALGQFHQQWDHLAEGRVPSEVHNLQFVDSGSDDFDSFQFSLNGLRCYEASASQGQFAPYDPYLPDDQQDRDRDFNDAVYGDVYTPEGLGRPPWDIVYVLDPEEEDQTDPCDPRELNSTARRVLEEGGMASFDDVVLNGEYVLHLAARASPRRQTDRPGDKPLPGLSPAYFWRTDADYQEHLFYPLEPMRMEVEVRLDKEPYTAIFSFDITIEHYGEWNMNTRPFGEKLCTNCCPGSTGGNPRERNWNGFDIIIDVEGGGCRSGLLDDVGMFNGGGASTEWDEYSQNVDIYMYTGAGISYTNPIYPGSPIYGSAVEYAAAFIHSILEQQTAGIYGSGMVIYERSIGDIAGALSQADSGFGTPGAWVHGIYRYDVVGNTFALLPRLPDPPLSERDQNNHNPLSTDRDLFPFLYWAYPYGYISKAACRYAIALILEGPTMANLSNGTYGDPEMSPTACC